ncbi:MAG: GatB/YqeY domain-containing protein [Patescibacteria group bacterium]|nr:GatB/YqeY domain-containing protein [Patescibacteria group bacterium]
MEIKTQIEEKMKEALKNQNTEVLSLFRMLKSAIKNAEIEKRAELEDADVIRVLEREAKQRRDSIEQYRAGNREDLANHEQSELEIIEEFLPQKMTEEEIRAEVKDIISKNSDQDFGRIMGAVMFRLSGKADGSLVQKIVRSEMGA